MNSQRIPYILIAVLLGMATLGGCASAPPVLGTAQNPILMAIVPSSDTGKITLAGQQLADMLKAKTGLTYKITMSTSYSASGEAMGAKQFHVGWLDVDSYLVAHQKYGVEAGLITVRKDSTFHYGQIIVNNKSHVRSMSELKGKKFCYVSVNSPSDYFIPRSMMKAYGIDPDKDLGGSQTVGSHDNVVMAVYDGECDAGATFADARRAVVKEYPDVMERTSVLLMSPKLPNDTVCYIKDFSPDLRRATSNALLEIAQTPDGKLVLQALYQIDGFARQDDSSFSGLRATLKDVGLDLATPTR